MAYATVYVFQWCFKTQLGVALGDGKAGEETGSNATASFTIGARPSLYTSHSLISSTFAIGCCVFKTSAHHSNRPPVAVHLSPSSGKKNYYTRGDVTCSVCEVAGGNPGRMALPPAVTHRVRPPYVSSPDVEPPIHVSTSTHTTSLPSSDFSTDAPSASDNSRALPGHRSSTTENIQPPQPTAAAWHPSYPLHNRPATSATDCYRMSPPHTPSLISRKNATVSLSDSTKTSTSAVVL